MEWVLRGLKIGRLAGVTIRVHITLILLLLWQLTNPGPGGWAMTLAFSVGVFVCILLHEFGHVAGARFCGGHADEIMMWPLGGLGSSVPPRHPTAALVTTACGPVVTIVLWLGLGALSHVLEPGSTAQGYCGELSRWNRLMAIFNLLPMFPLDGGRMFRDILWHKLTLWRAAEITMWVGRVCAVLMCGHATATGSFFLLLIGLFVLTQNIRPHQLMEGLDFGWDQFNLKERIRDAVPRVVVKRQGIQSVASPAFKGVSKPPPTRKRPEPGPDRMGGVDEILEKISREGISSLTDKEREKLLEASREL